MNRRVASSLIVAGLMCIAGYAALFIAPDERTMHDAQRIFYFHVSSWVAMFVAFFVSVFGCFAYLTTRSQRYDWIGVAGAEVGLVCCTIGLITGPLWANPRGGFGGRGIRGSRRLLFFGCYTLHISCYAPW